MSEKRNDPQGSERRWTRIIGHTVKWISIAVVLALVLGTLVQLLWNWLMPALFGLRKIDYLQGIGLILLSRVLFGGMGKRREHAGYLTGKYGFRDLIGRGSAQEDAAKGDTEDPR